MSMANESIFERAGRLFFTRERVRVLEKEISTAGVNMPADSFAGYIAINVIVITLFLSAIMLLYPPSIGMISGTLNAYMELPFAVIAFIVIPICFVFVYFGTTALLATYLIMKTEDRRNKLETALPDFLTLVESNIKAGMTLDQAMWYSAKPEFGLLSDEVKIVMKGAFSGESLESALDKLSSRFESKVFKRTILLLKQATATGGELTDVLERTADDVRNTIITKKEIAASLVIYEIFVLFAAIIGTPFLFAVAVKLIEVFERIPVPSGGLGGGGSPIAPFSNISISGPVISSSDFFWFTVPTIFVTALISSFIVSVIRTGSKGQGMKYFPFVLLLSYLVYYLVITAVESFFASVA